MPLLAVALVAALGASSSTQVEYAVVDPAVSNEAIMAMPAIGTQTESEAAAVLRQRPVGDPADPTAPALQVVHSRFPGYPRGVVREGVEGVVELVFSVDEAGRVRDIEVISSPDPRLSAECVAAMGQWRFRPPMKAGVPTTVRARQRFPFRLM